MEAKIKIVLKNDQKIEAALAGVNGRATTHTYTSYCEIEAVASEAEAKLESLGLPKSERAGAVVYAESGSTVANSYDYSRKGTRVRLERNTAGWVLTEINAVTLYKSPRPASLVLTEAQDAKIIEVTRSQYRIAPTQAQEAA